MTAEGKRSNNCTMLRRLVRSLAKMKRKTSSELPKDPPTPLPQEDSEEYVRQFEKYVKFWKDYWRRAEEEKLAAAAQAGSSGTQQDAVEVTSEQTDLDGEDEPLSDSDAEREESLREHVPELPIFVMLHQTCPKIRRVHTKRPGLFVYNGAVCLYWPALHEVPTKFSGSLKKLLRKCVDKPIARLIMDSYAKHYKLWHIYGQFRIVVHDEEDLEKNFLELLNEVIVQTLVMYHCNGIELGHWTAWKRGMIRDAKYQRRGFPESALKGAKLFKKPFIRGQLKYDELKDRTSYTGSWEDEEESDAESWPSPPRYW